MTRTGTPPVLFLCVVLAALGETAHAQLTVRSWLTWRTIETPHFAFHYPVELEEWTRDIASRMESIDSAVSRVVGYRPSRTVHVVVDDPFESANGSAWPYLNRPIMNFWATPPDPREDIGNYRVWSDMLATHEYAHIAHLTRPSRNGFVRRLWSALPVDFGPVARKSPRWAIEGYATLVEGQISGSGRPHGAWRAAFLRQWAIEGALPTYQQLSNWSAFAGGEFAYLAGSAYLEWLVQRGGDSSLVHVWRRLSAKRNRTFDAAFTGVFGEAPATLYRRFTAEVTASAMAVGREMVKPTADTGAIVQRLTWSTGDPAFSTNGERVAIPLRSATLPGRLVIWKTAEEPDTTRARRDSAVRAADPEDVPARSIYPPPNRVVASLRAVGGLAYQGPRFLRDGRVLVWRYVARGDGTLTTDLFLWNPPSRSARRVTRYAGVKNADPSPDGRSAVAERCRYGHCDVVRVDLSTGNVTTVRSGDVRRSFYRPRWSPDGRSVVVSVHDGDRWRLHMLDIATGSSQAIDPDDGANRYDAAFMSPTTLVAVSEASGVANLEVLDIASRRSHAITRVTGAAIAPVAHPTDQSIWFLSLYSRGFDLRRVDARRDEVASAVAIGDSLAPATVVPPKDSSVLHSGPVSTPRPYSIGTRLFRWIPAPQWSADGVSGALALVSSDVVGRSELLGLVAFGERGTWRGAALNATWRGLKSPIRLSAFDASQRLSSTLPRIAFPSQLDVRLTGGSIALSAGRATEEHQVRARLVGSIARFTHVGDSVTVANTVGLEPSTRRLVVMDLAESWQRRVGAARFSWGLSQNLSRGSSNGAPIYRFVFAGSAGVSMPGLFGVIASGQRGFVNFDADPFEQFTLGGSPVPLIDDALLTQRVSMAALPTAVDAGSAFASYRFTIPLAPVSPFLWAASTRNLVDRKFTHWHRVLGVEFSISVPHIPLAGTPAARAQVGVGQSLDEPFRKKFRGYVNLVFP
jgi:hypothetical protein